ncbi:MAG: insulinase family protein [Phycisphaerales bacterium]|nr:insulinase family protein [Phycisphaerales bacterium]
MIEQHTLHNGLVLACEQRTSTPSVALSLRLPAGSAYDTDEDDGCGAILLELLSRGAGDMNSRALCEAMDLVGMQRGGGIGARSIHFHACLTADRLEEAIQLLALNIMQPRLPASDLEPARRLCMQALDRLSDEPGRECGHLLRSNWLPRPFHRSGLGSQKGLSNIDMDRVRARWKMCFCPEGSVLAVSGGVSPTKVQALVSEAMTDWQGVTKPLTATQPNKGGLLSVERDSSQVHVAMAWEAPLRGADSEAARLACACLGGTTSGRLFTSIRQQKSLCYSIGASYHATGYAGWYQLHAGTTGENATELISASIHEIHRASQDLRDDEIERTRRSVISAMLIGGESTSNRAAQLSSDLMEIGTCRTLAQRVAALEQVSCEHVRDIASQQANICPSVVTVGPMTQHELESAAG